jgi:hypothetical protein
LDIVASSKVPDGAESAFGSMMALKRYSWHRMKQTLTLPRHACNRIGASAGALLRHDSSPTATDPSARITRLPDSWHDFPNETAPQK